MSRETVTLGDIDKLAIEVNRKPDIKHWKTTVKAFAIKHNLTDRKVFPSQRVVTFIGA